MADGGLINDGSGRYQQRAETISCHAGNESTIRRQEELQLLCSCYEAAL